MRKKRATRSTSEKMCHSLLLQVPSAVVAMLFAHFDHSIAAGRIPRAAASRANDFLVGSRRRQVRMHVDSNHCHMQQLQESASPHVNSTTTDCVPAKKVKVSATKADAQSTTGPVSAEEKVIVFTYRSTYSAMHVAHSGGKTGIHTAQVLHILHAAQVQDHQRRHQRHEQ